MRRGRHLFLMLFAAAILTAGGTSEAQAPKAPNPEILKQVLNTKLQGLKPDGKTERQVLFQAVVAGTRDGGSFPFRVTLPVQGRSTVSFMSPRGAEATFCQKS